MKATTGETIFWTTFGFSEEEHETVEIPAGATGEVRAVEISETEGARVWVEFEEGIACVSVFAVSFTETECRTPQAEVAAVRARVEAARWTVEAVRARHAVEREAERAAGTRSVEAQTRRVSEIAMAQWAERMAVAVAERME